MASPKILETVNHDRNIVTQPEEDRRRRTIIVERRGSFGFTLQTYGIHHKRDGEIEIITYVDCVEYGGPAFRAGLRPGDVILSINGHDMEKVDHEFLVNYIHSCEKTMRMVVLFEHCVYKVELHMKYLRLKKALQEKKYELKQFCEKEHQLIQNLRDRGVPIPPNPYLVTRPRSLDPSSSCSTPSWASDDSSSGMLETLIPDDTVNCFGYPSTGISGYKSHTGVAHSSPVVVPKQFETLPRAAGAVRCLFSTTNDDAGSLMVLRQSWDSPQSSTCLSESTDFSRSSSPYSRTHSSPALSSRSGNQSEKDWPNIVQNDEEEADRNEVTRL